MTLNQLDRCAEYLRRIHKPNLVRQLAINAGRIRRRIDEPERDGVTRRRAG
jgi:hypothetical protein